MACYINDNCTGCGACKRVCIVFAIDGENGRKHAVNPKRCIDCTVCRRVCPSSAVEDANGNTLQPVKKSLWDTVKIDKNSCSACGLCVEACTFGAISISEPGFKGDLKVFAELSEPKKCVSCGLCVKRCPLKIISMKKNSKEGTV